MEHQDSSKKKAKNWLHRFLKMKNRLHERSNTLEVEDVRVRRNDYENTELSLRPHRNSFRKSLKKMHTRVKSCMFPQEATAPKCSVIVSSTADPCSSGVVGNTPPMVPERPTLQVGQSVIQESTPLRTRNHRIPTDEIVSLSNCFWYWGPMATAEAEERLQFKPDGTFLVRDSSSTSYLFSISFRSVGKTMHARIEYSRGRYNLCGTYTEGFSTVTELIQDAMKTSENGIYCYSRRGEHACEFPVRLTKPISRYTEVRSLKYLCKFVIRQYTNMNDIPKLPLPTVLHGYLLEKPYF